MTSEAIKKGTGIAVDTREAIKCYTRAATAGYTVAQFNLAACYLKGSTGIAVGQREAVK